MFGNAALNTAGRRVASPVIQGYRFDRNRDHAFAAQSLNPKGADKVAVGFFR